MTDPPPIVSEFDTVEQAEAHLRWLEAKVAASLADGRPVVEHDAAMARVRTYLGTFLTWRYWRALWRFFSGPVRWNHNQKFWDRVAREAERDKQVEKPE
ncbi:hypothetical protein OF829_15025 [Sphingomonas sp. LB-2]|uniref:type II toxin-antitoxin system RelB family antitoxin n=1 Tax=Sphingomonas caeni TaxID=2984949 RepID=UPI00222F1782|nr:hypothetical protein [Sphingomonas caeni]MCW3848546.1 hypothetical protein [Sphingomonas caeni]